MRIVTYNIQWGKGRDGRVDLDRIARTVASADVIALQEVERNWREMEHTDEVARLSALLPGHHAVYCPSVDFALPADPGRRRQYGLMVLSRHPVLTVRSWPLPRTRVLGQLSDPSILVECVIGYPARPFRLYVTHMNYISARCRLQQARAILQIMAAARAEGPLIGGRNVPDDAFGGDWMALGRADLPPMPDPAILLGDFNLTPGTAEYAVLCGPISPGEGRLVEDGLLADALTLAGLGEDEGITFPGNSAEPPVRIDHILVTPDLAPSIRAAWIDADADGSDHQPVWAEIDLSA